MGLAVSGGPDSIALLVLACDVLGPAQIAVATVDHGLRRQSAAEAALVAQLCSARGVAHATLTLTLAAGTAVQERARNARYRRRRKKGNCVIPTNGGHCFSPHRLPFSTCKKGREQENYHFTEIEDFHRTTLEKAERAGVFGSGGAVSSVVEHYLDTVGVAGSNPAPRTIFNLIYG